MVAPEDQVRQIHLHSIYLTQLQREKVRSQITPKGLFLQCLNRGLTHARSNVKLQ